MISLVGLILTFLGGAIVLLPEIPHLFNIAHRVPPFSAIHNAEETLYKDGKITASNTGFEKLIGSLMKGAQPYRSTSEYGLFRDFSAEFPSAEGPVKVDYDDCRILQIEREDDEFLDDSVFSVYLIPEETPESVESLPNVDEGQTLLTRTEIPNGRLPELIREYKRGIVAKTGLVLMCGGFAIGLIGHLVS